MYRKFHLIALALVAAAAAPTAQATSPAPDLAARTEAKGYLAITRALVSQSQAPALADRRSPDPRDAATSQSIPRVGNGVFGPAVPTRSSPITIGATADRPSPDPRDAATSQSIPRVGNGVFGPTGPTRSGPVTIGAKAAGPSPDTADAALLAHSPVVKVMNPSTFAWREFGIGAVAAAGAILLLLGARAGLLAGRRRGDVARPTVSA